MIWHPGQVLVLRGRWLVMRVPEREPPPREALAATYLAWGNQSRGTPDYRDCHLPSGAELELLARVELDDERRHGVLMRALGGPAAGQLFVGSERGMAGDLDLPAQPDPGPWPAAAQVRECERAITNACQASEG